MKKNLSTEVYILSLSNIVPFALGKVLNVYKYYLYALLHCLAHSLNCPTSPMALWIGGKMFKDCKTSISSLHFPSPL